jgi:putative ABC transport system ATP-binding protein
MMNQIILQKITPAPLAGVIDLNTQVWEKEIFFEKGNKYKIYAPSGKGKSTLIHLIYGLRADFSGNIILDKDPVTNIKKNQWADFRQKQISIVFQDLRLFLHLTAYENIRVKSVLHGNTKDEEIIQMADELGVSKLLHKRTSNLSYGERQRIAIIRSLTQPFDWLLLDEPFGHLDKENIKKAAALIEREVGKRKAGMIVTSLGHDDFFKYDFEYSL